VHRVVDIQHVLTIADMGDQKDTKGAPRAGDKVSVYWRWMILGCS
jgi:hypothetical protein